METKDELLSECEKYFEKVMQDYNQHRNGRSLRKYCKEEGVDYDWLIEYKKNYPPVRKKRLLKLLDSSPSLWRKRRFLPYGKLPNWFCPALMGTWLR